MPLRSINAVTSAVIVPTELEQFIKKASNYTWSMYCAMSGYYAAIITVVFVMILSFLLPDISQKLHATNELKTMKKILTKMSDEVKRAEVACITAADEICYLHCNMHDDTTETVSIRSTGGNHDNVIRLHRFLRCSENRDHNPKLT